ncbi:MAG: hypothetical protein KatS3mg111_2055 [Pirellulaceae bacterium]|nr:MAG: hypothetical protein KatS3mg111_2055 [Pirellulaceae bacterium]
MVTQHIVSIGWWSLGVILLWRSAYGQVVVPLGASEAELWRRAQVSALEQARQKADGQVAVELECQWRWLQAWQPGTLGEQPLLARDDLPKYHPEPALDPQGMVAELRERLLGSEAKPTIADTRRLKGLLEEHGDDWGVRQLHLQWLDQPVYRKQYADQIADAAQYLAERLAVDVDQDERVKWAAAWAWYRCGRALAYRELPDVVADRPLPDSDAHDGRLRYVWQQLRDLVGEDRPEFVLLQIRMLRRDGFLGQALVKLEEFGRAVDRKWLLKKRRDLLRELHWEWPATEAASVLEARFPEFAEQAN